MRTSIYQTTCLFKKKQWLLILFFSLTSLLSLAAAPANDNCTSPQVITVSGNGYGAGTFKSTEVNIGDATKQAGETFAPAILVASQTDKSIWFKFSIATTRSVRVTLKQPGIAIGAGDVGFTVYKANRCLPTNADISSKLTPIALFGDTYHPCVEPGDYLVQVSAKSNANGLLSIQLDVAETGATYDSPKDAQEFGKLISPSNTHVDFAVECQSLEDETEVCTVNGKKQPYTRSTWHTFTTPAYFDYLAVELAKQDANTGREVVGIKLYKGNVKTAGIGGITLVKDCDSLVLNQYYMGYKTLTCDELDRNTIYTIQLLYKQDFDRNVRLSIELAGSTATKGPEGILTKIHADNKLGTLKADGNGVYTYIKDQFGCNSRHSENPCNYNKTGTGVLYGGKKYNLSTFFTFNLSTMSELYIAPYIISCGNSDFLYRVYKGYPTTACTDLDKSKLVTEFVSQQTLSCLPAGNYTLQIFGRDSATNYPWYSYYNLGNNQKHCLQYNFGQDFQVQLRVKSIREASLFDLSNKDAFNKINVVSAVMKPLEYGKTYQALADTFGCENTVLPDGITCKPYYASDTVTKAMYREFVVSDTGMMNFSNQNWHNLSYKLYKGDASTLATAQNKFNYPQMIKGLTDYTECINSYSGYPLNVCLVPGTYTYVTSGYQEQIGQRDQPTLKFDLLETKYNSPFKAQNMGSLWDSIGNQTSGSRISDVDYFSCRDNAVDINGVKPCTINGKPATKAIYRQFYLKEAAVVTIYNSQNVGYMRLFSGKATDGLSGLKPLGGTWDCFTYHATTDQCNPLAAGWYTLVAYGSGPTYDQPMKNLNELGPQSYVGVSHQFTINISKGCPDSKYNRPHKAAIDTITKKPFLIEWKPRVGHTEAYPKTDTTYKLYQENFNCKLDTPFLYVEPCETSATRVAYYVFQTTQESFVQINTFGYWASVYDKDIRKDSLSMKTATPIQTCLNSQGQIQLCKLQPGTYTLVVFVTSNYSCTNVAPTVYIDKVGYSRFDHATKAYDFGTLAPDSLWYKGKKGDVNPLNKDRAPSNDFFYCTTGSQKNDPNESACYVDYLPSIYKYGNNIALYDKDSYRASYHIPRRNLWYTFVVDKPGWVRIKVTNKTIGKQSSLHQYPYAVYKSNVDASLPYADIVANGQVDSTYAQGLTFIKNNITYSPYCYSNEEISFYRDPCSNSVERYYILVDNRNSYPNGHDMNPNSQVEVEILLDSVNAVKPKYDHYSQAYDFGQVGAGKFKGGTDNYSCATDDETDPIGDGYKYCAKKTLWYKFTSTVTGNVRYRIKVNDKDYKYYYPDVQLLREVVKGDSTSKGLDYERYQSVPFNDNSNWSQNCISKGTYYLLLTGCERINENVFPEIEIIEQAGDYCSAPVTAKLSGAGAREAKVIVDCHTIGTDYGEFGPKLTCPENVPTNQYKSSWFRIDIEGKDTLDVTAYIVENTNASSAQIKYRMMTGDCGAMQEQSCVQDALTQNTYECLAPGRSYYIQVLTPVALNGTQVTGDINLKLSAKKHTSDCLPPPACLVNANFQSEFDCTKESTVRFINFSTFGSSIKYKWEFGHDNQTSAEVSPAHFFPVLATDKSYKVRLIIENTTCGEKDTAEATVRVPGRPFVNLGNDTSLCVVGSQISFDATSHTGATYSWSTGSTQPKVTLQSAGFHRLTVEINFNGCKAKDTVDVFINGLAKKQIQNVLLCGESVNLSGYRGWGETYKWSNGETGNTITVKQPGTYWVDMKLYGCTLRDTFMVASLEDAQPLGKDTTLCLTSTGYMLDATFNGASSYTWQDGSRNATLKITKGGTYWVDIQVSNCTVRDSIIISEGVPPKPVIAGALQFCKGDSVQLDGGEFDHYKWNTGATTRYIFVNKAGPYIVSVRNEGGCEASSPAVQVVERSNPVPKITGLRTLCENDSISLNAGTGFTNYSWNNGAATQQITIKSPGKYKVKVTNANGCSGMDSVIVLPSSTPKQELLAISLCQGASYTLPSGRVVNMTGVYNDSVKSVSGCDSLVTTVNLVINAKYTTTVNASICTGQTYKLPSGQVVNKSGEYTHVFTSKSGCDSTVVTKLVVADILKQQVDTAICKGQSFRLPSGKIVNSTGVYNDTLQTTSGCDSVIVTRLTIRDIIQKNVSATICTGQVYTLPAGSQVNNAGIYRDTLHTAAGCDSVVITILQVQDILRSSVTSSICHGQRFQLPSGLFTDKAGTYSDTLRTAAGCDSIVTTTLKINPIIATTVNASICSNESYTLPSGLNVGQNGTYRDTIKTTDGCDSLVITHLTVHDIKRTSVSHRICKGAFYTLPSGRQVNVAGQYLDTLSSTTGCDSIITTNLEVLDFVKQEKEATICNGQSYQLPSGRLITTTGVYQDTVRAKGGCDSLITSLTLSVKSVTRENKQVVVCEGSSYTLSSGMIITQNGTYRDTLRYSVGCDSLITTITLRAERAVKQTINDKICVGTTYELPSGKIINSAGTYLDTVRSVQGCDSLISTVNIQVMSVSRVSAKALICNGYSFTLPSGKQVSASGVYTDTLRYQLGCDSLITTLTLDVFAITRKSITATICDGNSYTLPSGAIVTSTNTYLDTIKSVNGCDSLITTVDLNVSPRPEFSVTTLSEVCIGERTMLTATGGDRYEWLPENVVETPSSATTWVLPDTTTSYRVAISHDACQIKDTLTAKVIVNPKPDVTVSKSNDINCIIGYSKLTATGGAKYEWSPIIGLTDAQSFNPEARPSQNTVYTVKVTTDAGCVDEKSIEIKVVPGPGLYDMPSAFTPNNDGLNDCFGVKSWGVVTDLKISIYSRWGELLFETTDPKQCWDGRYKGLKQQTGVYVYIVQANTNCGPVTRKGTVTLIR